MKKRERIELLILGIVSLIGGLSSFIGSILTSNNIGSIMAGPLAIIGIILIVASVKAK